MERFVCGLFTYQKLLVVHYTSLFSNLPLFRISLSRCLHISKFLLNHLISKSADGALSFLFLVNWCIPQALFNLLHYLFYSFNCLVRCSYIFIHSYANDSLYFHSFQTWSLFASRGSYTSLFGFLFTQFSMVQIHLLFISVSVWVWGTNKLFLTFYFTRHFITLNPSLWGWLFISFL